MTASPFDAERAAIEGLIAANWTATPIEYENADWVQPSDGSPWVRITVLSGTGSRMELGDGPRMHRYVGIIDLSIFVREKTGTSQARKFADQLGAIFYDGRQLPLSNGAGSVLLRTGYYQRLGLEFGFSRATLSVPYWRTSVI